KIAEVFLQEHYRLYLDIPIMRNNRLRTTQGRYVTKWDKTPMRREISGQTLEYGTYDAIVGIIKHECIHNALHQRDKPYKDDTAWLKKEIKKHGTQNTKTILIGKSYIFSCNKCGKTGETRRKQLMKTPDK